VSAGSPEEQIRELAQGLEPVRPIPPLRAVLTASVGAGLVALAVHWLFGGPGLRTDGSAVSGLPYLATLAGLVVTAVGALGAAFAAVVPGREAAARLGALVAAAGLMLALTGGLRGVAGGYDALSAGELTDCLDCMGRALVLGAAPLCLACAFIVYAAVRLPGAAAALAVAGGMALGAAAVHATCPSDSPMHWLLAHSLAPVAATVLLAAPLAALLARRTRNE